MTRYLSSWLLFVALVGTGCNFVCDDKIANEASSPDKVLTATAFVRDCGATTGFSTIVTLHKHGTNFRDQEDIVFVAKGVHKLKIDWTAARAIRIQCFDCSRAQIFKEVVEFGDIDLSY